MQEKVINWMNETVNNCSVQAAHIDVDNIASADVASSSGVLKNKVTIETRPESSEIASYFT